MSVNDDESSKAWSSRSFNCCVTWSPEIGRKKSRPHVFATPCRPRSSCSTQARGRRPKFVRDGKKLISELQVAGADEKCVDAQHQNGLLIGTIKISLLWPLSCHANWRFKINRNLFSPRWIDMQNGSIFSRALIAREIFFFSAEKSHVVQSRFIYWLVKCLKGIDAIIA